MFVLVGMALGYVLHGIATHWRTSVWLALSVRLLLFAIVVIVLARSYGPAAGFIAVFASIVTRGLLMRARADHAR